MEPADSENWVELAACRGRSVSIFYPTSDTSSNYGSTIGSISTHDKQAARTICNRCPVWTQCLTDAIKTNDKHGIRAGKDYSERRVWAMKANEQPCPKCGAVDWAYTNGKRRCRPCRSTRMKDYDQNRRHLQPEQPIRRRMTRAEWKLAIIRADQEAASGRVAPPPLDPDLRPRPQPVWPPRLSSD